MRLISFVCALLLLVGIPVGAAPAEEVRLTVSRLVLAYPQATEDIYCGTVPAQEITWQSENPAVIEVADGVVTALAPGETEGAMVVMVTTMPSGDCPCPRGDGDYSQLERAGQYLRGFLPDRLPGGISEFLRPGTAPANANAGGAPAGGLPFL